MSIGAGIGQAFVELFAQVERWPRLKICSELASDALGDTHARQRAHPDCGFARTEGAVYFRQPLEAR